MNEHTNGVHDPMAGWVIAFDNGQTFIGCPDASLLRLCPVFGLGVQVQQVSPTQTRVQWVAHPILLIGSFDSIALNPHATLKPLSELAPEDQSRLFAAARQAEQTQRDVRLGSIGLTLATEMPRR